MPLWSREEALRYVQERVRLHRAALCEDVPPICTPDERWATPTTYAVMKQGRKSALKVCQSRKEAQEWMRDNGGEWVQERSGEDKRCLNYCSFGKQGLCPYKGRIEQGDRQRVTG